MVAGGDYSTTWTSPPDGLNGVSIGLLKNGDFGIMIATMSDTATSTNAFGMQVYPVDNSYSFFSGKVLNVTFEGDGWSEVVSHTPASSSDSFVGLLSGKGKIKKVSVTGFTSGMSQPYYWPLTNFNVFGTVTVEMVGGARASPDGHD